MTDIDAEQDDQLDVDTLARGLRSRFPDLRRCAADLLGQMGPRALEAVSDLIDALGDEDDGAHYAVSVALARIAAEVPAVASDLERALSSTEKRIREGAAAALNMLEGTGNK